MNKKNYFLRLGELEWCLDQLKGLAADSGLECGSLTEKLFRIAEKFNKLLQGRSFFYGEKWLKEIKICDQIQNELITAGPINLDKLIPLTAELYKDMDQFISSITIDEVLGE